MQPVLAKPVDDPGVTRCRRGRRRDRGAGQVRQRVRLALDVKKRLRPIEPGKHLGEAHGPAPGGMGTVGKVIEVMRLGPLQRGGVKDRGSADPGAKRCEKRLLASVDRGLDRIGPESPDAARHRIAHHEVERGFLGPQPRAALFEKQHLHSGLGQRPPGHTAADPGANHDGIPGGFGDVGKAGGHGRFVCTGGVRGVYRGCTAGIWPKSGLIRTPQGGDCPAQAASGVRPEHGCRSRSWRCRHGPEGSGSPADRPRFPAGASQRRGAGCGG